MNDIIEEFYTAISLGREVELELDGVPFFSSYDGLTWCLENCNTNEKQYFKKPEDLTNSISTTSKITIKYIL